MSTADQRPARFLAELQQLERGPLAQLRRGLGADDSSVYWLEGLYVRSGYGEAPPTSKAALRLLAGLYALKNRPRDEEAAAPDSDTAAHNEADNSGANSAKAKQGPSIGQLMGQLYLSQDCRPSTEKRFLALLDADRDGLGHHMRHTVMLLAGADLTPDWLRLTRDLLYWGSEVRRQWAKDFYAQIHREAKTNHTAAATPEQATPETAAPQPFVAQATYSPQDEEEGETL